MNYKVLEGKFAKAKYIPGNSKKIVLHLAPLKERKNKELINVLWRKANVLSSCVKNVIIGDIRIKEEEFPIYTYLEITDELTLMSYLPGNMDDTSYDVAKYFIQA